MKYIILLTLIAYSLCGWNIGRCPKVEREQGTFEPEAYLGKWYEQIRDKSIAFSKGDCDVANYSLNPNGIIDVLNTELRKDGKRVQAKGEAEIVDNFRLALTFGDNPVSKLIKGDYQILKTDYDSYSVVYSCLDFFVGRYEMVWILSRTPRMNVEKLDELVSYVNALGFTHDQLHITNQTNDYCGY